MRILQCTRVWRLSCIVIACLVIMVSLLLTQCSPAQNDTELRRAFEKHYAAWRAHCDAVRYSSDLNDYLGRSPDYNAMVQMGPVILPYLIGHRTKGDGVVWDGFLLSAVTRVGTEMEDHPWGTQPLAQWWQAGPEPSYARFRKLSAAWEQLKVDKDPVIWVDRTILNRKRGRLETTREETEVAKAYHRLRGMGVLCLPPLMDQLQQGDYHLLWLAPAVTGGRCPAQGNDTPDVAAKRMLQWWQKNKATWEIPWPKQQ